MSEKGSESKRNFGRVDRVYIGMTPSFLRVGTIVRLLDRPFFYSFQ